MYRVIKVLNNNGVLALDAEKKQEVILLGNGVGFGKRAGQRFEGAADARRYELVKKETSALPVSYTHLRSTRITARRP